MIGIVAYILGIIVGFLFIGAIISQIQQNAVAKACPNPWIQEAEAFVGDLKEDMGILEEENEEAEYIWDL